MNLLDVAAFIAGLAINAVLMFDVIASMLVPRPVPARLQLSAWMRRHAWVRWKLWFLTAQPPKRREAILGFFATISVVATLVVWLVGFVFGFGLLIWALRGDMHPVVTSLFEACYYAGASILTIGYGDIVALGVVSRIVSLMAGATGLAVVAIALAFLFSLFSSYRVRENFEIKLDARAGSPPSGLALLETHAQLELVDDLPHFFLGAQTWCADVLETHLAYPVLCYFRSAHVGMSWIAALGAVLDASTLIVSTIERIPTGQANLAQSVATHLVDDVAKYFNLTGDGGTLVERQEFVAAYERLAAAGFALRPVAEAWETFARLRAQYASSLNNIARYWAIEPAQWIGDRSVIGSRHE